MSQKRTKLFTVIGYCDGDYGVDTFVECVRAHDASDAWDVAVKRITKNGDNKSDNATEIVTYDGHLEPSERYKLQPRKSADQVVRDIAAKAEWKPSGDGWVDRAGKLVAGHNELARIAS